MSLPNIHTRQSNKILIIRHIRCTVFYPCSQCPHFTDTGHTFAPFSFPVSPFSGHRAHFCPLFVPSVPDFRTPGTLPAPSTPFFLLKCLRCPDFTDTSSVLPPFLLMEVHSLDHHRHFEVCRRTILRRWCAGSMRLSAARHRSETGLTANSLS